MKQEIMNGIPSVPGMTLTVCCGHGSVGEVWLGFDRWGRRRAVRLVSKHHDPALLALERRGAALYCRGSRDHVHLLKIFRMGETPEYFFSVMEPADNFHRAGDIYEPDTLGRRLRCRKGGKVPVFRCLDAILTGMAGLHARNLTHGDLHPDNILFVDHRLKIADPGLVCRADSIPRGGTAGFRPPWRATGLECDLYAFGKLIYLLCTGASPHRFPEIPEGCDFPAYFPLNEIALRCCERDPHLRFGKAGQVRRALNSVRRSARVRGYDFFCRVE